jgi:hypothetical protein
MSSDATEKTSNVKLEKLLDDGSSNNYGGCEVKWKAKLSAYKLWKYIAEPKPESLNIKLKEDVRHRGVKEGTTEEVIFLKKGNREVWEKAQKDNEPWLDGNRLALSAIVEALPDHKLYLVKDIDYAADAWNAIREEYKPMNARTIVLAKQELLGTKCPSHNSADVQKWITYMIMQRQALQDADSNAFGDEEFARHLIMLGPSGGDWTYTSTDLAKALLSGELNGKKITSQAVINAYKEQMALNDRKAKEESVMNANANGQRGEKRFSDNDYNGGRGNYPDPKRQRIEYNGPSLHSSQQRESIPQYRHTPGPSRGTLWCSNQFCRRQKGHSREDCFVYGGGKAGQYPPWWMGPWNLHLHPSQRGASQAPRGNPNTGNGQPHVYFTDFNNNGQTSSNQMWYPQPNTPYPYGTHSPAPYNPPCPPQYPPPPISYPPPPPPSATSPDLSGDPACHINNVVGPERMFIVNGQYIADIGDVQDLSESVNKLALTGDDQDDAVLWDTGATKGVFHDRAVFKEYTPLVPPVQVNAFGSNLATIAVAIGSVELESFIDDQHTDRFVLTRVLHIPDARVNLVSGIQLDQKGVFATTGNGKVALYTRNSTVPFAIGEIVNDLYKLKVRPVIYSAAADLPPRVLASASEGLALNTSECKSRSAPEIGDRVPNTAIQPLNPGVFAVPSLTSLYEQPTEEDKIRSFGTV